MRLVRNTIIAVIILAMCIVALIYVNDMPSDMEKQMDEQNKQMQEQMENGTTPQYEVDPSKWVELVKYEKNSYVNSKIIVENSNGSYTLAKIIDDKGTVDYIVESHPTIEVIPGNALYFAENFSYVVMADTIEKNCKDLKKYGLDNPQGKYTLVNENGTSTTILVGDKIGTFYYSMLEGDSTVYIIFGAYGDAVTSSFNDLGFRETNLVNIESGKIAEQLKLLRLDSRDGCIMNVRPAAEGDLVTASSSKFIMTEPYYLPIHTSKLIETIPSFTPVNVSTFIEDDPTDLAKYGLDNPQYTLTLQDNEGTYIIHFGNLTEDERRVYCIMEGKNFVFTMLKNKLDAFSTVDPYVLCDKYAHLVNLNDISSVQVVSTDGSRNYTMSVDRTGEAEKFLINGKVADEDNFRGVYRELVGIHYVADGGESAAKVTETLKITFNFNDGKTYVATYYEYDERNYVVDRNGEQSNFLISKKSINALYEALDYLDLSV